MTQAGAVRVLLLDPHPVFRSGLEQACAGDPRLAILGTYATGSTGLAAIRRYTPDVAVLELDLPDGRGRAILKACQSESLTTRLLVLTARNDGADVYDAIAAGAAGYMLKSAEQDAICESIAAVAAGETVLDAELHRHVAAEIRLHAVRAEIALTTREHDVLALVAQGFSSREIGSRLFVSETTVKTHLANLYGKLGVSSRAAAVAQAMRQGLVTA